MLFQKWIDKRIEAYQSDLIRKYCDEVEGMHTKMRIWRHDYHNHIRALQASMALEKYDEVNAYLRQLNNDLTHVDTSIKTGRVMVDAILNGKVNIANQNDIPVNAKAVLPDQISQALYIRPGCNNESLGYMIFRWTGNSQEPLPTENRYSLDKTGITISEEDDLLFYHIFCLLKTLAPSGANFSLQSPSGDMNRLERLAPKVDLYRQPAVEQLCKATDATAQEAKQLINDVFDARQEAQYAADPSFAVRDLNRVVR